MPRVVAAQALAALLSSGNARNVTMRKFICCPLALNLVGGTIRMTAVTAFLRTTARIIPPTHLDLS